MEKKKSKDDDWIKCSSKSRPGRYYMFNRATGETQWLPHNKEADSETSSVPGKTKLFESPPRVSVPKPLKTPAQDRLKRLQHAIKIDQVKKSSNKTARHSNPPNVEGKSKKLFDAKEQQENVLNDKPSTSTPSKSKQKPAPSPTKARTSPTRASKRPHTGNSLKKVTKSLPSVSSPKNARLSEPEETHKSIPTTPTKTFDMDFEMVPSESPTTSPSPVKTQQEAECKTSTLNSFSAGIVNKIKEICKLPFRSSQSKESRADSNETKTSKLLAKPTFKPNKKTEKKAEHVSSAVLEALNELREEQSKIVQTSNLNRSTETTSTSPQQSTPKNLNIPCYQRGSANSRLDRLRQSLLLQQPSTSAGDKKIHSADTVSPTNNPQSPTATAFNDSIKSVYQTANNTIDDESEAMDWQPIIKEESIEIASKDPDISLPKPNDSGAQTMGDIYDTVNENLLRLSAEKQRGSSKNNSKWLKDFYYFVADTNVLLECLAFIEDLTKLKLCDTKGSMLYIPYCVLQELDKLKMRSGCKEGVKTLAVRAIKYLNKKFENKSQHLLAQTALEERDHLIDVNSADDSIINCCLQAKAHVPNLLLLTEDVNLRNKAICNNILVSTKSDLVSKRYDDASS